jgi:hypothetical protein
MSVLWVRLRCIGGIYRIDGAIETRGNNKRGLSK